MNKEPARTPEQRRRDTLDRLERDEDVWVASTDGATPFLVPLSYLWDGETFVLGTLADSPTGRNLRESGQVRMAVGPTRDVVMIEGTVETLPPPEEIPASLGDAFADRLGFDPRALTGYAYYRVRPTRIQAWREANEIAGRELMRDAKWLV
jgi:nitroimidazol reductase NimA-like FMN-containing flavoprotein (pyridoxamine 5'-phosphate oxidase superfamily)